MKKNGYIVIVSFLFLVSCAPDDGPAPGTYFGKFHIKQEGAPDYDQSDNHILIQEPTATSIKINGEILSKKGYRIKGRMGNTTAVLSIDLFIDAKWRKKGGSYEIHGTFTAPTQSSSLTGTFEMTN